AAHRQDLLAVRAEGDVALLALLAREPVQLLAGVGVPEPHLALRFGASGRGYVAAVRAKGDVEDPGVRVAQGGQLAAAGHGAHFQLAARGLRLARDRGEAARVRAED